MNKPTTPAPAHKRDDADPAMQGEGNYTAARRVRQATEKFVQSGQVEPAARAAKPDSDAQARELLEAEKVGKSHAKK